MPATGRPQMWAGAHEEGADMGKTMVEERTRRRRRRSFTPEFKAEVVTMVRKGDRTVPTLCRERDLADTAVRRWVA